MWPLCKYQGHRLFSRTKKGAWTRSFTTQPGKSYMDLKFYGGRTREQKEDRGRLPDASPEGKARLGDAGSSGVSPLSWACQTEEDTQVGMGCHFGFPASSFRLSMHCKGCMEDWKYIPSREEPNFCMERNVIKFGGEGEDKGIMTKSVLMVRKKILVILSQGNFPFI